jgi:hypothetical protein
VAENTHQQAEDKAGGKQKEKNSGRRKEMETDDDASSNRRIEMLRVRLEQYNAAIAEAMGAVSGGAAELPSAGSGSQADAVKGSSPGPRLVPPSLQQQRPTAPPVAATVERSLINELLAAASRGASEGRKSSSCEVTTEGAPSETTTVTAHVVDDDKDEDEADLDVPCEPQPAPPAPPVTIAELEASYHAINAVEQSLKVVSSFVSVAPQLSHAEKLVGVCSSRDNMLRDLMEATAHASSEKQHTSGYWGKERDVQTMVRKLMDQCTEAQRHFGLVFDKKALIYNKEKQLEAKAAEMQRLHGALQAKRQMVAAQEASLDHRRHALSKREEDYKTRREEHKRREDRARQEIASVEKLGEKVASWMKILEARDDELAAKEQRLRNVQIDLTQRAQEIYQIRERAQRRK